MKRYLYFVIIVLATIIFSACDRLAVLVTSYPEFLESKYASIETTFYQKEEQDYLHISGLCMHSALAIKEVNNIVDGDTIILKIALEPTSSDNSGNFNIDLNLPEEVKFVAIKSKEQIIWERVE